jgi:hypothetical protein
MKIMDIWDVTPSLYIVPRDQHIQKTFCLLQQDISSTPKMDRASFSKISVIGYMLACHRRGLCLSSGPVHLGFVVDKAALRQVFLRLPFSHVCVISLLLPNSYFIPLTPPVLYDLRSCPCLCHLCAKLHGAMSQKFISSY